jgi:membrane protease subunit HflC
MRGPFVVVAIVLIVVGLFGYSALFTVHEAEQTLVLQFGKPVRVVKTAGLHFKLPFIQNVESFDKRVLDFNADNEEVPTRDQKQLVVNAFARYRILDPLLFFQTVNNVQGMEIRLANVINANLRAVFGEVELARLLTQERSQLVHLIAQRVNEQSKAFGVSVIDVRIKRVDLPEENSQAIYNRMQTQREQEARKIRAEGDRDSRRIRADADKQRTIIVSNAQKNGDIYRGEGDAEAQRIYNQAYGQDVEFFNFWASMQALQESLPSQNTRFVGPTDSDFFRYFGDMNGQMPAQAAPPQQPPGAGPTSTAPARTGDTAVSRRDEPLAQGQQAAPPPTP